jgi:hypothetical protein
MEAEPSNPCTPPAVPPLSLPQYMLGIGPRGPRCAHITFALSALGLRTTLPRVVFDSPAPQRTTISLRVRPG